MRRACWLTCLLVLGACRAPDDEIVKRATITGRVIDAASQQPLAGVHIDLLPALAAASSNAEGQFVLSGGIEADRSYRVRFEKAGYAVTILEDVVPQEGESTIADTALEALVPKLQLGAEQIDLGDLGDSAALSISDVGSDRTVLIWEIASTADWLEVEPARGEVVDRAAVVELRADRLVLGENYGEYSTELSVTSNGGSATVRVTLAHLDPADQALVISPERLDFGEDTGAITLRLENPGSRQLEWEVESLPFWLQLPTRSGVILPGDFTQLEAIVARSVLDPGQYVGELRFASNAAMGEAPVIPATMEVAGAPLPRPSAGFLNFGRDASTLILRVENAGKGAFEFDVEAVDRGGEPTAADCNIRPEVWVQPASGRVRGGRSATLAVNVNRAGMRPGLYTRQLFVRPRDDEGNALPALAVDLAYEVPVRSMLSIDGPTRIERPQQDFELTLRSGGEPPLWGDCDRQSNVSLPLTLRVVEAGSDTPSDFVRIAPDAARLELTAVDSERFLIGAAAPEVVLDGEVDWARVPRGQGQYNLEIVVESGLFRRRVPLSLIIPAPRVEPLTTIEGESLQGITHGGMAATYDPFEDRVYLYAHYDPDFENQSVIHEYDGRRFVPRRVGRGPHGPTTHAPSRAQMVLDRARDALVYVTLTERDEVRSFETWEWRGGEWMRMAPVESPGLRRDFSVVYDQWMNRSLLYGGVDENDNALDDLWAWDGENWALLTERLLDTDLRNGALGYDANFEVLLWHGGVRPNDTDEDIVELTVRIDPETLAPTVLPLPERLAAGGGRHSLVHSHHQQQTWAFGYCPGYANPNALRPVCSYGGVLLLDGGVNPEPAQIGRFEPIAQGSFTAWDAHRDRVLFFGHSCSDIRTWSCPGNQSPRIEVRELPLVRELPPRPSLTLDEARIDLEAQRSDDVVLRNGGDAVGPFRAEVTASWLSVDPPAGNVQPGGSRTLTLNADDAALAPGRYETEVVLRGAARTDLSFTVSLEVAP